MRNNILLFLISVFILGGCSSSDPRYKTKPKAYSKINEVTIVMDEVLWESEIGGSLRYYFSSPYLILPSPEPIFDLRYFLSHAWSNPAIIFIVYQWVFLLFCFLTFFSVFVFYFLVGGVW